MKGKKSEDFIKIPVFCTRPIVFMNRTIPTREQNFLRFFVELCLF